jgi:hypothetical protein
MARELILTGLNQITVVTREEVVIETDKISIDTLTDDGQSVVARISFYNSGGYSKSIVLWDGQEYINIGEWTDTQVEIRIKELLNLL